MASDRARTGTLPSLPEAVVPSMEFESNSSIFRNFPRRHGTSRPCSMSKVCRFLWEIGGRHLPPNADMPLIPRNRSLQQRRHRRRRSRTGLRVETLESRRLLTTWIVNTSDDAVDLDSGDGVCQIAGGGCSLRAAIQEANALGSQDAPHRIELPAGTYVLTIAGTDETQAQTGDLNIRTSLSIVGTNAATTIIDGGNLDRVIDVVLGTVAIQGVTIRGGLIDAEEEAFEFIGGGIRNQGNLTLIDSVVSGNIAGSGAGLANYDGGTVKVQRSVISGNGDATTTRGGGLFNYSAYDPTALEIIESTITGNQATTGGGLLNFSLDGIANTTIQRSTLSGNTASFGGGAANRSKILYGDTASATLSIRGSTVSGNTASNSGGGLHNRGDYGGASATDLLNTTITGNVASGLDGGGIHAVDSPDSSTNLSSTIVAGNSATREGHDLFGESISGSFNLIGDADGHLLIHGADNNLVGLDARLGPLADNGGPTLTHLLLEDSPAIDQGVNTLSFANDQRGSAYQRTVDITGIVNAADGTDIGSIEVGQVAASFDFGDAPQDVEINGSLRQYPTTLDRDGARHRVVPDGPFLGNLRPDAEADGQPSDHANADDLIGSDDEDSIAVGSIQLMPGQPITGVTIRHDGADQGAFLNVWLDLNLDGDWDDLGEHLVVDRSVPAGVSSTSLSDLTLPINATIGTSFLRTRISTVASLTPNGEASDGEVEDFQAIIGTPPVEMADLSLDQIADNLNPSIGDVVTLTITITNDGPDAATDVEVTNLLPPELLFEGAVVTQGTYEFEETWFVGRIAPGASAELQIRVLVDSSDSIEHTAEITYADQLDPDSTPANGISGEDDQASVTLGTCLSGGPLHIGKNRLTFSCATPGGWVGFVHGTLRGTKTFEQYNVTVDIADAEGVAIAIADSQGIASALVDLTQEQVNDAISDLGAPLIVQAFEMLPQRFKSNTLAISSDVQMLRAARIGRGAGEIDGGVIEAFVKAATARWDQLPLSSAERRLLSRVRVTVSDLPGDALARVLGHTIVVDADAAGNGWFVDPTVTNDEEFTQRTYHGRLHAMDPTAASRIDLLTTLMHEFGHVLGLSDTTNPDHLMHRQLDIGVRRVPVSNTNPGNTLDVNRDDRVTVLDALQIVNWLGRRSLRRDAASSLWLGDGSNESPYLDANADYQISAADALLIINNLARTRRDEPESLLSEPELSPEFSAGILPRDRLATPNDISAELKFAAETVESEFLPTFPRRQSDSLWLDSAPTYPTPDESIDPTRFETDRVDEAIQDLMSELEESTRQFV